MPTVCECTSQDTKEDFLWTVSQLDHLFGIEFLLKCRQILSDSQIFCARWTQEEAKAYQDYKKAVVESRSAQEWGLDLSFLQFLQIDIPTNFENILRLPTRS